MSCCTLWPAATATWKMRGASPVKNTLTVTVPTGTGARRKFPSASENATTASRSRLIRAFSTSVSLRALKMRPSIVPVSAVAGTEAASAEET